MSVQSKMRQILAKCFTAIAAISMVLNLAVIGLAIRSHWCADTFGCETAITPARRQRGGSVQSLLGLIHIELWWRQHWNWINIPQNTGGHGLFTASVRDD